MMDSHENEAAEAAEVATRVAATSEAILVARMGVLSALIDNVPLTAALLKADLQMNTAEWMGLTYAVGVGGSLLIIGSAAGIVAMSKLPGLTFLTYMRSFGLLFAAFVFGYISVYGLGLLVSG